MSDPYVQWLLEFVGTANRFWSGHGDFTFGGETYKGAGHLMSVSEAQTGLEPDRRLTIQLAIGDDETFRASLLTDPGPLAVRVRWIYSTDHGQTYTSIRSFRGYLSSPTITGDLYTIEVETSQGDVDRGAPRVWSPEAHASRFSGDKGMEQMRELAAGVPGTWPPMKS